MGWSMELAWCFIVLFSFLNYLFSFHSYLSPRCFLSLFIFFFFLILEVKWIVIYVAQIVEKKEHPCFFNWSAKKRKKKKESTLVHHCPAVAVWNQAYVNTFVVSSYKKMWSYYHLVLDFLAISSVAAVAL